MFQFLHLHASFENTRIYLSLGRHYFYPFSYAVSLRNAKIHFIQYSAIL